MAFHFTLKILVGTLSDKCNISSLFKFLAAERRCDGPVIFVKEENKRLGGPFEVDIYANLSLLECQAQCLGAEK